MIRVNVKLFMYVVMCREDFKKFMELCIMKKLQGFQMLDQN